MCSDLRPAIDRPPGLAAVIGPEGARGRNGDEDPARVRGIENDGVQAHATRARLPVGARAVAAKTSEFLPGLPAVAGAEQGSVFDSRVDCIRIGERRFEMPDALELPGMRRAVVPLVSAGNTVVDEFVVHRLPRLTAIVGALDHLAKPAGRLGRVQPVGVNGRSLHVVDFPACKVRTTDVPLFALAV